MCMWLEPSSHTSQKPRCMRHPGSVAVAPLPPLWKLLTRRGRVIKALPYGKPASRSAPSLNAPVATVGLFPTVGFLPVFHRPLLTKRPSVRHSRPSYDHLGVWPCPTRFID